MTRFFCFIILLLIAGNLKAQYIPKFDVYGHRISSDANPQNMIRAFTTALDSGVTTLKMEVVITKDKRVIVSAEPSMNLENCLRSDSTLLLRKYGKSVFNFYQMSYDEIRSLPCTDIALNKPLLRDVIVSVEEHIKGYTAYEVDYAIEIRSSGATDDKFHPGPEVYSDLVYQLIDQYLPLSRIVIQSSDFRVLKYWHKKYPEVRLCALISNGRSVTANLRDLGFKPSVYGIKYSALKQSQIRELHDKKIRVIPWAVNGIVDMRKVKDWGADGFVTAYPQRALQAGYGLKLSADTGSR